MPNVGGVKLAGELPSWREKRELLWVGSAPAAGLKLIAERFEKAEQLHDAADFWNRAGEREALERLRARGRQEGDWFLWQKCVRLLGVAPLPADEARQVGVAAKAAGRLFEARTAFLAAGDAAGAGEVEKLIPTALPVKPPEDAIAKAAEAAELAEAAKRAAPDAPGASG